MILQFSTEEPARIERAMVVLQTTAILNEALNNTRQVMDNTNDYERQGNVENGNEGPGGVLVDGDRADAIASVLAAVRSRGSDAEDFRGAVHEATHALQAKVPPPWDRERVNGYLARFCEGRPERLVEAEARARAAEMVACRQVGIEYDAPGWLAISVIEAGRFGISIPVVAFADRVDRIATAPETEHRVRRILKLK